MTTRRRFLLLLPAYAASAQTFVSPFHRQKPAPAMSMHVFIGTDTTKGVAKGIYRCSFENGHLGEPVLAAETQRPSFMAISPQRDAMHRSLFAVNAINDPAATITSFSLDMRSGALTQKNKVSSAGAGPCYISVDSTGKSAFVANYFGGTIASYRIQSDGTLSSPVETFDYHDAKYGARGPNPTRQDKPHPHSVHISPDDRFLIVNDLGSDSLTVYSIDPSTAKLTPSEPLVTNTRAGSGPRHIAFHPNGRWIYLINELDSTIDRFLWSTTRSATNPKGLLINAGATVSTLASGFPAAKNTASEIMVSPDGNFLYASNRGEDTLVVFAINDDGSLKEVQRISSGGKTPRHFTFDPTFQWILCGNQDSASITVFRRDQGTGKLTGPTQTVALDSPFYILFA
ncbi:lactonase family protein [Edaphobacter flagellatus]|uniref:lactonase family protein n=1 Tax=Edaphobacter flagellatus TaxID=1933044 RepID=UPI0021B3EC14|nr:lactonase family protein [Edaphobacter flagellatus]